MSTKSPTLTLRVTDAYYDGEACIEVTIPTCWHDRMLRATLFELASRVERLSEGDPWEVDISADTHLRGRVTCCTGVADDRFRALCFLRGVVRDFVAETEAEARRTGCHRVYGIHFED